MNIRKAVLKAKEQSRGITRKAWMPHETIIIPTNTIECMLLVPFDANQNSDKIIPRWEPTTDDLVATDWCVEG